MMDVLGGGGGRKVAHKIQVRISGTTQRPLVRPCENGSVIFKWIFKKYDG